MSKEVWLPVKGYEGIYEISSKGRLKSLDRLVDNYGGKTLFKGGIRKQSLDSYGYVRYNMSKNSKTKGCFGHRLVAEHFIDNPEMKPQVNHINGIKTDNRVENLEWSTPFENIKHSIEMGLQNVNKGEDVHFSVLTENQVREIREKYKPRKYTFKQLGLEYGVCYQTIQCIVRRKSWKHI